MGGCEWEWWEWLCQPSNCCRTSKKSRQGRKGSLVLVHESRRIDDRQGDEGGRDGGEERGKERKSKEDGGVRYNHVTPDDQYMTGEEIVKTLIDIVANNGNFLLDIGPAGDGSIPAIMQKGLRDAGAWIRGHNEAIFNTTYWSVTAGADPLRYTATADAFYIHHVGKPGGVVDIPDPVPYLPGDRVKVVGGTADGSEIRTKWTGPGTLRLVLPDKVVEGDRYVWTFKIEYVR